MTPLAVANFVLCSAIGWICLCRISVMSGPSTLKRFRAKYVALLVAFTASGFSHMLFNELPNMPQFLVGVAVLFDLWAGATAWRSGLPAHAKR
jgi:hypothetical protein